LSYCKTLAMDKVFESVFLYLTNLSSNIAYLAVFGILVACGLGLPLPEDIPLIATGYLIWDTTLNWVPAILCTISGVLIGDSILFYLGKKMGLKLLESGRVQTLFKPERVRRVRAYFRKYGDKIVFIARFVAGFRAIAFFMAGAMKMRFSRFILLDALAALISVPIWIAIGYGLGYYLGDEISSILRSMKHLKTGFTIGIFVIVGVVIVRSYLKYQRARINAAAKR
jgi:membrane protein DedA with SNARE-associated domain